MDGRAVAALRWQSAPKARLIDDMLTRYTCALARERLHQALSVFPLYLLLLAHDHPTRIWLLDENERLSSAGILTESKSLWCSYAHRLDLDECQGLTTVVNGAVAIVSSWSSPLVLRHEFAHALTTFLSPKAREGFVCLYGEALNRFRFIEPLAARNPGEYTACALSSYYFEDRREIMATVDRPLLGVVHQLVHEAEEISLRLCTPPRRFSLRPLTRSHLLAL